MLFVRLLNCFRVAFVPAIKVCFQVAAKQSIIEFTVRIEKATLTPPFPHFRKRTSSKTIEKRCFFHWKGEKMAYLYSTNVQGSFQDLKPPKSKSVNKVFSKQNPIAKICWLCALLLFRCWCCGCQHREEMAGAMKRGRAGPFCERAGSQNKLWRHCSQSAIKTWLHVTFIWMFAINPENKLKLS